jgi:hypothetical protein
MLYDPAHHQHEKHYIWRFENQLGVGIYGCGYGVIDKISSETGRDYRAHPTPMRETETMYGDGYKGYKLLVGRHCGFHSIDQARKWFFGESDMSLFAEHGIRLRAYQRNAEADAVELEWQTLFRKGRHVAEFDPQDLWRMNREQLHDAAFAQATGQSALID